MNYKITVIIALFLSLIVWSNSGFAAGLTDGLVGYWPLDGNGKDVSGNGHDAVLKGGADWVKDGWMNEALKTDGAGGHAVVDAAFQLITLEITVVARINGWRTIPWSGIVVGRGPTTFWMGVADNDTLTYVWNNNNAETWAWKGAPAVPENKWAMVAIAIEKDKATSYIYHRDSGKLDSAANEIPHIEQTVINLKFGWDECCGARYWKGIIDEVMIFDRTLSADEIKQLASQGLAVESHGKLTTTWGTLKRE